MNRDIRRNTHLRGTANVPGRVMQRLRELVPALAASLGQDRDGCHRGTYEAEITATADGGFFTPHVDDGNLRVRNRSTTFVLFFSEHPRPFRGGGCASNATGATRTGCTSSMLSPPAAWAIPRSQRSSTRSPIALLCSPAIGSMRSDPCRPYQPTSVVRRLR